MMGLFKEDLKEEDRVYCVINHSVQGVITKKTNYHGMYIYSIKVDDEKDFKRWFNLSSANVKFLHWQLAKIYKEVKEKNGKTKSSRKRA